MARDGSGDYTRVEGPYINGTIADADEINAELDDVSSALSDSINKAGTKAFAANQPMGGFRLTGLGAATTNGDAVRYEQLTGLSATYQPLDATLTALAALSTSASQYIRATGADTFTMDSYATVLSNVAALPLAGGTLTGTLTSRAVTPSANITYDLGALAAFWRVTYTQTIELGNSDTDSTLARRSGGGLLVDTAIETTGVQRGRVELSSETSGTLSAASANRKVSCSGNVTLDDGIFTADDFILFDPNGSNRTFTRASGLTMYVNGVDSASATLAAHQMGSAQWRSGSVVVLSGAFT